MPNRRTTLKWLHWLNFFLILCFFLLAPGESRTEPGGALSTPAGGVLLLAVATAIWLAMYLTTGPAGRPGPKLPGRAKKLHPLSDKILHQYLCVK